MSFSRRKFLTLAGASAAGVTMVSPLEAFYARVARGQEATSIGYGALQPRLPVNANELTNTIIGDLSNTPVLELPPGFTYRVFSITGQSMSDGAAVPGGHDGMAAFPGPGNTTILVRNHELNPGSRTAVFTSAEKKYSTAPGAKGGTTTLVVGPNRKLIKDFASLSGTIRNCAGGPTPWGSWITCEETFEATANGSFKHGYNFEVPASSEIGAVNPVPLTLMGRFSHEAVAVDPKTGYIYETEDRGDSCFYRFVPSVKPTKVGDLAQNGGTLYALKIKGSATSVNTSNNPTLPTMATGGTVGRIRVGEPMQVEWVKIDQPNPDTDTVRREAQAKGAAIFFRGEGAWYGNGKVYFTSTQGGPPALDPESGKRGNGQIWVYDPAAETVTLQIEADPSGTVLDEPDNVVVAPFGDLFLCEDSSDDFQYVVGLNESGQLYQFAKNAINDSEFAGACFSPDGKTMFLNIQTPGLTFAIWGPWNAKRQG